MCSPTTTRPTPADAAANAALLAQSVLGVIALMQANPNGPCYHVWERAVVTTTRDVMRLCIVAAAACTCGDCLECRELDLRDMRSDEHVCDDCERSYGPGAACRCDGPLPEPCRVCGELTRDTVVNARGEDVPECGTCANVEVDPVTDAAHYRDYGY
jgi:hypothetical protein